MEVFEIKNKNELDIFLNSKKHSEFLQSWQWGEFQEKSGLKIFRLGVKNEKKLLAVSTIIKKKIGLGKYYFYCPRGPVFSTQHTKHNTQHEVEDFVFNETKKIAKKEKCLFLRFEPSQTRHSKIDIRKSIDLQPAKTLMIDLSKTEEKILSEMHQKTRYNIRLSSKKGVKIIKSGLEEFDKFWTLMNLTSSRDGFRIHSKEHYKKLLELDFVELYLAVFNGKTIAAGMFSFFGDTVTYMHGASSSEERNVMAPFLIQWELIKTAKNKSYKYYDFYGIDDFKWPGVTRFKKGFGGFEKTYPGTFDIPFNSMWYNMYIFLRKLRRKIK